MSRPTESAVVREMGDEASRARVAYVRTLLGFVILAVLGGIGLVIYQYRTQSALVEQNALHEAVRHTRALAELRTMYTTEVVATAQRHGLKVTHDYREHDDAIPLPATLSLLLGERIASRGSGSQTRLYSPYPFPWREDGGLPDEFGEAAWEALRRDGSTPFYRLEESGGRTTLRYATADVMRAACVDCHNEHPRSPRTDWKEGDVRGVLEVTVPLDAAMSLTRTNARESTAITIFLIVLGLAGLGIAARRLRRSAMKSESRVRSQADKLADINHRLRRQMAELEEAEHAVRESQASYRSLVETIPMHVLRKDLDGRFTFANQRFCDMLDRPLEEIIGKTDFDFFPEELARNYQADDKQVVERMKTIETVEENRRPDGRAIFVHVMKSPVLDDDGNAMGVQAVFWDVTEQKLAEERVQLSERRYRQLTEGAQDAIVVSDGDGFITLFNSAAERCFGYTQDEVLGKSVTMLMPESLIAAHRAGLERYRATGVSDVIGATVELRGVKKGGEEFDLDLSLSSIELPEGAGFLANIHDSSERHRMQRRVTQSEKLASLGMLSAGVAHEINNPLAYVANNMEVLTRDVLSLRKALHAYGEAVADGAPTDEIAGRIETMSREVDLTYIDANIERILGSTTQGVKRVAEIVNGLRGFAHLDRADTDRVDLRDTVNAAHEMIRGQLSRRNITLEETIGDVPHVRGNPAKLNQVALNLLANAMQAIDDSANGGGTIAVTARVSGEDVILEIADDGPGIPPDKLEKIFDPFFTTKSVGEGTGLGLSITHGIVSDHGGHIEATNRPGGGAVFRIFLKAADGSP